MCFRPAGSSSSSSSSSSAGPDGGAEISEHQFHEVAERELEVLQDAFEALEDSIEDMDVMNSQGVLTAELGEDTWVINKQVPNRQIWWSSPLSGPKRFEWQPATETWAGSRDSTENLHALLRDEVRSSFGLEMTFEGDE
jgi:frataxin